jgi:hypothetical protein
MRSAGGTYFKSDPDGALYIGLTDVTPVAKLGAAV